MSRYGSYGKDDTRLGVDGDSGFVALNMKLDVDKLPPATLSYSLNLRLRRGIAETRGGFITPWCFNGPLAADSNGAITQRLWSTIYGSGVYSNPNVPTGTGIANSEWLTLGTDTGVWLAADGWFPIEVPMPPGEVILGACSFVEFQGNLILFRGQGAPVLVWDGSRGDGFQYVAQPDITDEEGNPTGILGIPEADYAVPFANRLYVPAPTNYGAIPPASTAGPLDAILASDVLDYTSYDGINDQFVINSGTNDELMALVPYSTTALLAFKRNSIWILQNVMGDLTGATQSAVTTAMGTCARNSCVPVGADVLFLCAAPPGVYRVNQVIQSTVQTSPVPVSDPIEPLIARINWAAAGGACGVLWKEYYLLAVPLDGSAVNNAILVYNTVGGPSGQGAWESLDTFNASVAALGNGQSLVYSTVGTGTLGGSYTIVGPGVPYSPVIINSTPGTPGTPPTWVPAPAALDYLFGSTENIDDSYWAGMRIAVTGTGNSTLDGTWCTAPGAPEYQGQANTQSVLYIPGTGSSVPAIGIWGIGGDSTMPPAGNFVVYLKNLRQYYPGASIVIAMQAITGPSTSLQQVTTSLQGTAGGSAVIAGNGINNVYAPSGSYTTLFNLTFGSAIPPSPNPPDPSNPDLIFSPIGQLDVTLIQLAATLGTPQNPGTPGTITASGGGGSPGTITIISLGQGVQPAPPSFATPGPGADSFQVTNYASARRLFLIDAAGGYVYLAEEGTSDMLGNQWGAITSALTTRGYTFQDPTTLKGFRYLSVALGATGPCLSVSVCTEGVNAVMPLAENLLGKPTRYDIWGKPAWDPTNVNNDFQAAGRDDYAVTLPMELGSGILLDLPQEKVRRWPCRARGRWATVNIANASGYCAIRSIETQGLEIADGARPTL
jgi:hypothetical protein